jgi:hypothetical protein
MRYSRSSSSACQRFRVRVEPTGVWRFLPPVQFVVRHRDFEAATGMDALVGR